MEKLIVDKLPRITKNRKRLEEALNVKITNRGTEVYIEGNGENEYIAEKVIQALNFGFPVSKALLIQDEEFIFEIISIKDHTNRKDLARVRGRIIGAKGKTIKTLSDLTKCNFERKDNFMGIIGPAVCMQNAQEAIISIIKGSKQSNVYAHLERNQPKPVIDLGLKE